MAMCCVLLSLPVSPHAIDDPNSLDSFIRDFASNRSRRRTGRLYEVVLPANFSGIEASIVTLKSGSLWMRGANFSLFGIPPRVLPWPYVRRLEIVYENLGNWSSSYFNPPNHTLVSPVIGLIAYEEKRSRNGSYGINSKIELNVIKDPITLHFPYISLPHHNNNVNASALKCVGFQSNGTVEFSNVSRNRTCSVRGVGHFSLPTDIPNPVSEESHTIEPIEAQLELPPEPNTELSSAEPITESTLLETTTLLPDITLEPLDLKLNMKQDN
nr:Lipoprotein signal peptidase [Ipomoea batatas]